ncbi:MAG TPA: hypothetical protein VGO61_07440, partial [Steroidobacteraceae bacterium]|nr:hypothetical protein [Steroidobacteraceae bacterium]
MRSLAALSFAVLVTASPAQIPANPERSAIDRVWSGHSVRFSLEVTERAVFVGYYDASRQLTVATRPRESASWTYRRLDSWTGWDSHN